MPAHHPGTFVAHNDVDRSDVPWALTTHLLSINHDQLLRTTRHPFLARAARGTLPKPVISQWLANDQLYLVGHTQLINNLLASVRRSKNTNQLHGVELDVETRLIAWLESAYQNAKREATFFQEVAEIYKIDLSTSPIPQHLKSEGLRRFEVLFGTISAQQPNKFIPWLDGAVLLWATEKVYYEAWSWARRQDAQSSPRTFDSDEDGGAMRREFIPNWSNRDFLMFVEQLERILNEGISQAVGRDDAKWLEVKSRTDAIWRAVLDAEEAFWPDVSGTEFKQPQEPAVGDLRENMDEPTLNSADEEILRKEEEGKMGWNGHIPVHV